MGLKNVYRYGRGSRARGRDHAVGCWLAIKIPDNKRDQPERVTVANLGDLAKYGTTPVREALAALVDIGEIERISKAGKADAYRIVWGRLNPPDPEHEPPEELADWQARQIAPEAARRTGNAPPPAESDEVATGREMGASNGQGGHGQQRVARPTRSALPVQRAARHPSNDVKALKAVRAAPKARPPSGSAVASGAVKQIVDLI
jgi:hypothetical protein